MDNNNTIMIAKQDFILISFNIYSIKLYIVAERPETV